MKDQIRLRILRRHLQKSEDYRKRLLTANPSPSRFCCPIQAALEERYPNYLAVVGMFGAFLYPREVTRSHAGHMSFKLPGRKSFKLLPDALEYRQAWDSSFKPDPKPKTITLQIV